MRSLAVLSLTLALAVSPKSCEEQSLDELLACHDAAVGGDALRAVQRIEFEFKTDKSDAMRGRYRATRTGQARIDLFSEGKRAFSTGWDGQQGWMLPEGADEPEPHPNGATVLRRGTELPGRLWTLADMPRNGHTLRAGGREDIDGTDYYVVDLKLADGFQSRYLVHPETCLIERQRSLGGPQAAQENAETVFEDFRTVQGITQPHRQRNIDGTTRNTVYEQQVLEITFDPDWGPEAMSAGPGDDPAQDRTL